MLGQILMHLKNWFVVPGGIHLGTFEIKNKTMEIPFLQNGQYFRVVGSVFNDGVYQYPAKDLFDEKFEGAIWALAIPSKLIALSDEIQEWQKKYGNVVEGPYQSESFAGYSYTRATNTKTGQAVTWKDVFRSQLSIWRKI